VLIDNVRALCKEKGISLFALERELNIGNGTVAKWGKSSPRVETVKLVADYFGVTVDELVREVV